MLLFIDNNLHINFLTDELCINRQKPVLSYQKDSRLFKVLCWSPSSLLILNNVYRLQKRTDVWQDPKYVSES